MKNAVYRIKRQVSREGIKNPLVSASDSRYFIESSTGGDVDLRIVNMLARYGADEGAVIMLPLESDMFNAREQILLACQDKYMDSAEIRHGSEIVFRPAIVIYGISPEEANHIAASVVSDYFIHISSTKPATLHIAHKKFKGNKNVQLSRPG